MPIINLKGGDMNLYSPSRYKPRTSTGFASKEKAKKTLKNIKSFPIVYQKQVVITMYNRARYHPHRTISMTEAMQVYRQWMKRNKISISNKKTRKT